MKTSPSSHCCAIMQPTYLPWAGYFNLIANSDVFIFLDDVSLSKQSWQVRNRIYLNGKPFWLTVPIRRLSLSQKICEVKIVDTLNWKKKHFMTLKQAYKKKPFGHQILKLMDEAYSLPFTLLADLTVFIIENISVKLGFEITFVRSSQLGLPEQRTKRLIRICSHFNCNRYLSPQGSREYLEKDGDFVHSPVILSYQDFTPPPYFQGYNDPFISHLSIIDVIANIGWEETAKYVSSPNTSTGLKPVTLLFENPLKEIAPQSIPSER